MTLLRVVTKVYKIKILKTNMFTIELLTLLKSIKQSDNPTSYYPSLYKLISENEDKYLAFKQTPEYTQEIETIITTAIETTKQKEEEAKLDIIDDDFSKIKQVYLLWQQEYNKTHSITPKNSELVESIINFYAENRFDVLEKILEIETDRDYELFKNHLRNKLRTYFSNKMLEYSKSQQYNKLNFINKFKKKKEVVDLLNEINAYTFNVKKIKEVLQ